MTAARVPTAKDVAVRQGEPGRLPIVTIVVLTIIVITNGLQFLVPGFLDALRRDPQALAAGQWWRMVSPLLVNDGGLLGCMYVAIGILLVGVLVEQLFGWWRWLVLFFAAGLVGELMGYAWDPHGAGASIALFGLAAGLLVWLFRYHGPVQIASLYLVGLIAALVGLAFGGWIAAAVLAGLVCSGLFWLLRLKGEGRMPARFVVVVGMVGAVVLTVLRDIHGPAILTGVCVGAVMLWAEKSTALR
jgi:rhomboid protease GluP